MTTKTWTKTWTRTGRGAFAGWQMAAPLAVVAGLVAIGIAIPALAKPAPAEPAQKSEKAGAAQTAQPAAAGKGAAATPAADKAGAAAPAAAPATPAASMAAALDRLKALAGDWVMAGGDGSVAASYRVTALGTAVIETLFPGTPHEMVTVYHRDGDSLMLTHYCSMGNQPRMKATPEGTAKQLEFKFASATNLKSPNDEHMHEALIRFDDVDKLHSEWSDYQGGKVKQVMKFDLVRKKS